MRISQNDIELGTKIYRYRLEGDRTLRVKSGKVVKDILEHNGEIWDRGKKVAFEEGGDSIYFSKYPKHSIPIDEYDRNRVLLLEENPQRAMELFIQFEEDKISSLYEEIEMRKDKIIKLKEVL